MINEQLQKQIEQEAIDGTSRLSNNSDYYIGFNKGYETGYEGAGEKYGEKWQAAEAKADRYEKLIEQLNNQTFIKGVPGATQGDTKYDSMAAAAGYNQAIMNLKAMILKALTPKTSSDDKVDG